MPASVKEQCRSTLQHIPVPLSCACEAWSCLATAASAFCSRHLSYPLGGFLRFPICMCTGVYHAGVSMVCCMCRTGCPAQPRKMYTQPNVISCRTTIITINCTMQRHGRPLRFVSWRFLRAAVSTFHQPGINQFAAIPCAFAGPFGRKTGYSVHWGHCSNNYRTNGRGSLRNGMHLVSISHHHPHTTHTDNRYIPLHGNTIMRSGHQAQHA